MSEEMDSRARQLAQYMIETGATVRAAAGQFGISKSTVHKDLTQRLREIDGLLYDQVRTVLDRNKEERHIRGGMATRRNTRAPDSRLSPSGERRLALCYRSSASWTGCSSFCSGTPV